MKSIINLDNKKNNINLKFFWLFFIIKLLNYCFSSIIFFYKNLKSFYNDKCFINYFKKKISINFNTKIDTRYKSLYRNKLSFAISVDKVKQVNSVKINKNNSLLFPIFKSFLNTNIFSAKIVLKSHSSWISFFIKNSISGNYTISIRKMFTRWKNIFYLLFNLLFYKINLLVFGTSFFKKEILSINWVKNKKLINLWRYFSQFLYFKPGKIFDDAYYIFYKLRMSNLHTAFILDIIYHYKTVFFLKKTGFYTIASVPVNLDMHVVDIAIPLNSNNLFNQMFFIRFFLNINKSVSLEKYNFYKNTIKFIS